MLMMMMMAKVSIEPVERWERGILALKIIDELTMWFFTIGQHPFDDDDSHADDDGDYHDDDDDDYYGDDWADDDHQDENKDGHQYEQ